MTEISFDSDALRKHSGDLSADASVLGEGVSAAGATKATVDGGAFGLMCSFLAGPVNNAIASNSQQIQQCADFLVGLGEAVSGVADDIDAYEAALKEAIEKVTKGLG